MNIYSSPLDLYLASACQLNPQKNPASFMLAAPFMSQLDPLSQQKYLSLLSARQQQQAQQAERLNDPNLYTYAPMKKVKTEQHSSNSTAASNTYSQEVPSQERELFNKLTNHNALNYSKFPAPSPYGSMKNNQPYQGAFPSQQKAQEQKSSFIDLDSDDEDCVIVEKQSAAPLTVPPPQLNYHNMNLPPSFSDFITKNHFHNNNFNRPQQFNHPVSNLLTHPHQNNFYQNRPPYAGVASLQGFEAMKKQYENPYHQIKKEPIVIEEEENHDDTNTSHTTAHSANDHRSSLTLPGYQNNYYLQQMLNSRFQMPPQMHFNNQFANMKQMWGQQQMINSSFMNFNSQNLQNDLKIVTKVEEKETKEIKEKKKPKKKPRSPKRRAERKIELPIGPETMQADMKLDEPYVIELHIDPNDPNPNVCDTMVGDEFQTDVPPLALNKGIVGRKREIRCRWNPDDIEREKLLEYFTDLEKRTEFEITSEIAKIRLLKDNQYDIAKSLEEVDQNLVFYKGILKLTKRRGRRSK